MRTSITTTIIVALIAMIGMTGLALADSTDMYFNGDGSYSTSYQGSGGGYLHIGTYTPDGEDHHEVTYDAIMSGNQNMNTASGYTLVNRYSQTDYGDGVLDGYSEDNSANYVSAGAKSSTHTKMWQTVRIGSTSAFGSADYVGVYTYLRAQRGYDVGVFTGAGFDNGGTPHNTNDDTYGGMTGVDASGDRHAVIQTNSLAGSTAGGYLTGQGITVSMADDGSAGEANIGSLSANGFGGAVSVTNDGGSYTANWDLNTGDNNLHDEYGYGYYATGYIYAVSWQV